MTINVSPFACVHKHACISVRSTCEPGELFACELAIAIKIQKRERKIGFAFSQMFCFSIVVLRSR